MEKRIVNNYKFQFSVIGLILGVAITVSVYTLALTGSEMLFTLGNIFKLHKQSYYFYVVDIVPLVTVILGGYLGSVTLKIANTLYDLQVKKDDVSKDMMLFAENLSVGELEADFKPEKENILGNILIKLRDSLVKSKNDEVQRKNEDDQRNWIAEGLAKFGEILRQNNDNIEVLSYELVSNLCKYVRAVQGGFFLINDELEDDKHFELTAHFAYGRKKYTNKRIEMNEGLVGRAAFEMNTIYVDEVPDDYVEVTSGLGESNPKVLLIVPLKVNEEVHGVIELSSFDYFEKHIIEFVEKVSESIATTISTVKINIRTSKLLDESQAVTERLAQQEEEMRQNMEELQATQEEAAKQAEQFISFTNSVNHTLIRAEYDTNGILLYANTKFLAKLGYAGNSDVEGHHISMFISDKDKDWFNDIWDSLANGGKHFEGYMKHVTKTGKDLWTMATYTCVRNLNNEVEKILFLAIDTTEQKEQSLDFEGQIAAINRTSLKLEIAPSGRLLTVNELFFETLGYDTEDIKDFSIFSIMPDDDQNSFEDVWNDIVAGNSRKFQSRFYTIGKKILWFDITYSAVENMYGEISKIIAIANDISEQKEMEMLTQEQNQLLKKQEEELKASEQQLQEKLDEARREVKQQFQEIEKVKIRTEKTLEGAHDAIFTINQYGIIEFFNRAAESLWGYGRKDVIGESVKKLFTDVEEDEDEMIYTLLRPEKRKIIGNRKETSITTKNGDKLSVIIMLAGAKVQNEYTYTAFIQNIEVELF